MIGLLDGRASARQFPFHVDFDAELVASQSDDNNDGFTAHWLPLAVTSPGLMHATLMIASSHVAALRGENVEVATEVAFHKGNCLTLLNRTLGDLNEACSDASIGSVIALASHDVSILSSLRVCHLLTGVQLMFGAYQSWNSHMKGLKRILDL